MRIARMARSVVASVARSKRATVALLALVTAGSLFVAVSPAQAISKNNRDGCRGYVSSLSNRGSVVAMRYVIACNVTQTKIAVVADLGHSKSSSNARKGKFCSNSKSCMVEVVKSNPAGQQMFYSNAFAAQATRGSHTVGCGYIAGLLTGGLTLDGLMTCGVRNELR